MGENGQGHFHHHEWTLRYCMWSPTGPGLGEAGRNGVMQGSALVGDEAAADAGRDEMTQR